MEKATPSQEEIEEILDSYKWIKVKQPVYEPGIDLESVQTNFERLEQHHIEETTFLIEKVRELALKIKELR
jgi:hypothetical protein